MDPMAHNPSANASCLKVNANRSSTMPVSEIRAPMLPGTSRHFRTGADDFASGLTTSSVFNTSTSLVTGNDFPVTNPILPRRPFNVFTRSRC
ncbi:hypothetical protein IGB42_00422 [Andreprevotia sp. IGB-42]|nr:hypothetical protein IGB42_00422 [Andreprevotia sp. IGB-42]